MLQVNLKPVRWSESLDYSFAIGRLRALEVSFLDRLRYERLIRTENVREFLSILSESRYGQFHPEENINNPEVWFRRVQEENLQFCLQYAFDDWLRRLLQLPVEMHNLKVALKSRLGQGPFPVEKWELTVSGQYRRKAGKFPRIAAVIDNGVQEAFQRAKMENDPSMIDVVLDRVEQEVALNLSTGQEYALGFYRLFADVVNVQTVVRLKQLGEDARILEQAFLPGGRLPKDLLVPLIKAEGEAIEAVLGSTAYGQLLWIGLKASAEKGSLLPMERRGRELLIEYVNAARYVALGYEPLFRFSRLLDNELTNLRLLYSAKVSGLESERCQELVVYAF
ncbi:MAG: V-type ATPase subunit [bacterium]